jgi:hypothetical protein
MLYGKYIHILYQDVISNVVTLLSPMLFTLSVNKLVLIQETETNVDTLVSYIHTYIHTL